MTLSGFCLKRCFEADFGIWRLILLFVRFFLVQTFMGLAIAACTLFGPIMFRVQPDLIEAPIRIPFLSSRVLRGVVQGKETLQQFDKSDKCSQTLCDFCQRKIRFFVRRRTVLFALSEPIDFVGISVACCMLAHTFSH